MKLHRGEAIVCSKGHRVGEIPTDVPDGEIVPTDALSIDYAIGRGYACELCNEVVARMESDDRWRVRTTRGWIA